MSFIYSIVEAYGNRLKSNCYYSILKRFGRFYWKVRYFIHIWADHYTHTVDDDEVYYVTVWYTELG
jgi:hypothetical protein